MPESNCQTPSDLRPVRALNGTLNIVGDEMAKCHAENRQIGAVEHTGIKGQPDLSALAEYAWDIDGEIRSTRSAVAVLRAEPSQTNPIIGIREVRPSAEDDPRSLVGQPSRKVNEPTETSIQHAEFTSGPCTKAAQHPVLISLPSENVDIAKVQEAGKSTESTGAHGVPSPRDKEALEEFRKHIVIEKGRKQSTYEMYASRCLALARFLEPRGRDLIGARQEDLAVFFDDLRKRNLESTVAQKATALRCLYHFLLIDEYIEIEPTLDLKVTKPSTRTRKAMTREEVRKMLTPKLPLPQDPMKRAIVLRNNALLHALYGDALRVCEAINMVRDDLHIDSSRVVVHGKGNKERMLPLVKSVKDPMSLYLKEGRGLLEERAKLKRGNSLEVPADNVFLSKNGRPSTRQLISSIVQKADPTATPHRLRHSRATHMAEQGASTAFIQKMLGHDQQRTTRIYVCLPQSSLNATHHKCHPRGGRS